MTVAYTNISPATVTINLQAKKRMLKPLVTEYTLSSRWFNPIQPNGASFTNYEFCDQGLQTPCYRVLTAQLVKKHENSLQFS